MLKQITTAIVLALFLAGCAVKDKIINEPIQTQQRMDGSEPTAASLKTCAVHALPDLVLSAGISSLASGGIALPIMILYSVGSYTVCVDDRITRGIRVDVKAVSEEVKNDLAQDLQSSFEGAKTAVESKRIQLDVSVEKAKSDIQKEGAHQKGLLKEVANDAVIKIESHVKSFRNVEFEIYEREVEAP